MRDRGRRCSSIMMDKRENEEDDEYKTLINLHVLERGSLEFRIQK